jgi:hypothetical protein
MRKIDVDDLHVPSLPSGKVERSSATTTRGMGASSFCGMFSSAPS